MRTSKIDQTARKRRLILVFVGHTCQKVHFLKLRLIQTISMLSVNPL